MAFEDPKFWANLHQPRVDRRLSALDVHQADRRSARKSPDGPYRAERRGPAARARRALKTQFRTRIDIGLSFRQFVARAAKQLTTNGGAP